MNTTKFCMTGWHIRCHPKTERECDCDCHGIQWGKSAEVNDTQPTMSMQQAIEEIFIEQPDLRTFIAKGNFAVGDNGENASDVEALVRAVIAKRGRWGDTVKVVFCSECGWAIRPGDSCPTHTDAPTVESWHMSPEQVAATMAQYE